MEVYPVQGRITLQGKPMRGGGSIAFVPISNQAGKTAGGEIQSDGTYYLSTYTDGDGSIPGEFRVVITQVVEAEPQVAADIEDTSDTSEAAPTPISGPLVAPADQIPPVYSDHQNSPLTTRVEGASSNDLDFELTR